MNHIHRYLLDGGVWGCLVARQRSPQQNFINPTQK